MKTRAIGGNNYVYFDDYKVRHVKSNLVQGNEYYPFGMQASNSWTREAVTGNNYLANGGTELNQTSQLYDLHYRNYDATLGRMFQVDHMASKYGSITPYNYSLNNPTNMNDPLGDDVEPEPPYPREYKCAMCWRDNESTWLYSRVNGGVMNSYGGWSGGGYYGGGGPMDKYWHPGDGRMFWSGYEAGQREMRGDIEAMRYGEMTSSQFERKYSESADLYENYIDWYVNGVYTDSQFTGYSLKTSKGELVWSNVGMVDYYGDTQDGAEYVESILVFNGVTANDSFRKDGTLTWYAMYSDGSHLRIASWAANSGSSNRLPIPSGQWILSNYRERAERGFVRNGVGFSVDITPDPAWGRSALRIHPDQDPRGTEGCIGLTSDAVGLYKFASMISNHLLANGTMRLFVSGSDIGLGAITVSPR